MINIKTKYYIPPSDPIFEEVKNQAIEIWKTYDDTHGYATGKINRIKELPNIEDNFMYMVAMFDIYNLDKLSKKLSKKAKKAIYERLEGTTLQLIFK